MQFDHAANGPRLSADLSAIVTYRKLSLRQFVKPRADRATRPSMTGTRGPMGPRFNKGC